MPSPPARVLATFALLALLCTAAWAVLQWTVGPRLGLIRQFYPQAALTGRPLLEDRSTEIGLGFIDERPDLAARYFGVRWAGYWYQPRGESIDLYAGGDDEVVVYVDRRLILRRDPANGTSTISQRLDLAAGPHQLVVRYKQYGGSASLNIQWARPGRAPAAFTYGDLFVAPPDASDYWRARLLGWLVWLLPYLWLVPPSVVLLFLGVRHETQAWRRLTLRELGHSASRLIVPSLLGPFIVFVVGSHTIFLANRSEFAVGFAEIASPTLLDALGLAWAALFVVGLGTCLLSDRVRQTYIALLIALGVLAWIQGTFLVADYGPLYGEGLDLGQFARRAPYEGGMWLAGAAVAIAFARSIARHATLVGGVFIGVQALALAVPASASSRPAAQGLEQPPEPIYRLSRTENVIHIVLDGFLSDVFAEAIDEDAGIRNAFRGFVFFPDHLGAFPTTRASMPAMLTGLAYRNDTSFDEFLARTLRRQSIATVLAERGFAVHSISFHDFDQPPMPDEQRLDVVRYVIPTPFGLRSDYVRAAALQLLDLSLFRSVPQGLKPYVYNDEHWLAQSYALRKDMPSERARHDRASNHAAFLGDLIGRLRVAGPEPVYTFIHVALPHPPSVLSADCEYLGFVHFNRASYTAQARCGLLVVDHLLEKLRSVGVFDSSLILLTSDHGWRVPRQDHPLRSAMTPIGSLERIALPAMPLLVVKPPGATGPLRISSAPSTITDVPATVVGLLGLPNPFPGASVLQLDTDRPRPRTFAYHSWTNADWNRAYFDRLFIFSVNGPVRDPRSWTLQNTIPDPTSGTTDSARTP